MSKRPPTTPDAAKADARPKRIPTTGPARPEMAETDIARTAPSRNEPARPETTGASPDTDDGTEEEDPARPDDAQGDRNASTNTDRPEAPPSSTTPKPASEGSGFTPPQEVADAIRDHRGAFVALAVALIVAGVAAFIFPLLASIAAKVLVGWLLLIAGSVTLFHAFRTRRWRSTLWNAAIGLLSVVAGIYLAFFPLAGLIGLTLVLGALFATQGIFEIIMALDNRERPGWGWMLGSGTLSLLLGVVVMFGLPGTAVWALGLVLGVHFVTSGVSLLALTRTV